VQLGSEAVPRDPEDMFGVPTGPAVKHVQSERHACRKFGSSPLLRLGVHQVHLSECSRDCLEQGPEGICLHE